MKSYILHGENQPEIHKNLVQLTEQAKSEELDIARIDWKKSNEKEIKLASRSQGLISLGTLVVVDNFFNNNKHAAKIISELSFDSSYYIFVENKTISPTLVKALQRDFVIQGYPVPPSIFNFLNSLSPNNKTDALTQFKKVIDQDSSEFLLTMAARHTRQLIWAKEDPQTLKAADWQKTKLVTQAKQFSDGQLRELHSKLLEIDRFNKKSLLPESLEKSLEVLVASL